MSFLNKNIFKLEISILLICMFIYLLIYLFHIYIV